MASKPSNSDTNGFRYVAYYYAASLNRDDITKLRTTTAASKPHHLLFSYSTLQYEWVRNTKKPYPGKQMCNFSKRCA